MLSILRRTKKFLPIGKITTHFAHRFFSIQEKFAHYSKNLGCATDEYQIVDQYLSYFVIFSLPNFQQLKHLSMKFAEKHILNLILFKIKH